MTDWGVNAAPTCTFSWITEWPPIRLAVISKNSQTCSKSHHFYTTCSKCLPLEHMRSQMSTNWNDASNPVNNLHHAVTEHAVGDGAIVYTRLRSYWRQIFRVYHVKMTQLTTRLTTFETITASRVCVYSSTYSLKCTCKYCVHGSICHFRFPKVVLAHILGEVGILCTVLLSVYCRTYLPILLKSVHIWQTQSEK